MWFQQYFQHQDGVHPFVSALLQVAGYESLLFATSIHNPSPHPTRAREPSLSNTLQEAVDMHAYQKEI